MITPPEKFPLEPSQHELISHFMLKLGQNASVNNIPILNEALSHMSFSRHPLLDCECLYLIAFGCPDSSGNFLTEAEYWDLHSLGVDYRKNRHTFPDAHWMIWYSVTQCCAVFSSYVGCMASSHSSEPRKSPVTQLIDWIARDWRVSQRKHDDEKNYKGMHTVHSLNQYLEALEKSFKDRASSSTLLPSHLVIGIHKTGGLLVSSLARLVDAWRNSSADR